MQELANRSGGLRSIASGGVGRQEYEVEELILHSSGKEGKRGGFKI